MKVLLIAALVAVAAARPQEYHDDVFHFSSKVNHENLARPSIVSSVPVVKSVVPQYQQYSQYSQYPQYQQYNQYAQYPQYQQYKQYSQYAQYPQYQQYNQYVQSVPAYSHSHSHVHAAHHVVEQPSVLFRSVEQEVPAVTAVHTTHVHQPAVYSQVAAVHKEVAPVVSRASVVPQYHHGVETYTKILKQVQEFDPAGIYRADYATENGITAAEHGTVKDINAKEGPVAAKEGSYSYTGPDGVLYSVNWVADEFGFRASGAHLPGAEEIKKSVDLIASQPQKYDAEGNLVYKQF